MGEVGSGVASRAKYDGDPRATLGAAAHNLAAAWRCLAGCLQLELGASLAQINCSPG
jgi:hypothetical protein